MNKQLISVVRDQENSVRVASVLASDTLSVPSKGIKFIPVKA
jgi:hypothetical protein